MSANRHDLREFQHPQCGGKGCQERNNVDGDGLCTHTVSTLDNLPIRCVGEWAYDKIYRPVQYFGTFAGGMSKKWVGLNYVEICSGPGRCITREDRKEIDGTAMAIIRHKHFPKLKQGIFIDSSRRVVDILNRRIKDLGDDGKTWTLKKTGLGHPDNMRVYRVILHRDGTLFALICAKRPASGQPLMPEGVGLYRSKDSAETWEKINASKPLLYPKDFSVDPRDSRRILMGAADAGRGDQSGGLYLTEDGGQAWQRIGREGPQTFGGYFHPNHDGWIYMTLTEDAPGAGLWLSRDNGKTWRAFDELPFANIQRVEFDPANDAVIHVTTFGGSVWRGPATPSEP